MTSLGCSGPIPTSAPANSARPVRNGRCSHAFSAARALGRTNWPRRSTSRRSRLGRLIDKLTAAGLVERRDDESDRRANRLYLTEKAAPALKELGALAEDLMGRALAGVDESTIRAMHDGLVTIKANLKNELIAGAESK